MYKFITEYVYIFPCKHGPSLLLFKIGSTKVSLPLKTTHHLLLPTAHLSHQH